MPTRTDMLRYAVMEYFSNPSCKISLIAKHLCHGLNLRKMLPHINRVPVDACLIRIEPRHQRGAARSTKWVLAIRVLKPNSPLSEAINMGRLHEGVAVTA